MLCLSRAVAVLALGGAVLGVAPGSAVADGEGVQTDRGRMILVLDSSGSMAERTPGGPTRISAAKQALTRVVETLPDESDVGLRVYGATVFDRSQKGACTDSQLVVPPGVDNRAELGRAIADFEPYGETPIAYALREAASDLGAEGQRSIVLVSDGIATCAPDPCRVAGELTDAGIDLHIDVVGLDVEGEARSQLRCIAQQGKGTYYNVESADEIAQTLIRVSERAVRPFTLTGTPLEGTADPTSAPVIGQGQWTDTLGGKGTPEAVRHFRVMRTIPDSTIHVTATTQGTPDRWDEVSVALTSPEGTECDDAKDSRTIDQFSILSAEVSAGRDGSFPEEECSQGDEVIVRVERGNFDDTRSAPFSLTVFEEPPATGVDQLPEWEDVATYVAPGVSGPAQPLVAGAGFADAPRVGTGRYALDIVPGETQIVRVPVDWGQQLTARASFPAGTPGVRELTGVQGPFVNVQMYGSLLGTLSGAYVGTNETAIMPGIDPAELTAMAAPVRYRNRASYANEAPALPGDQFVVISANADEDGDTWIQPYTLEVEVLGDPAGAPSYPAGTQVTQPLEAVAASTGQGSPTPAADPSAGEASDAGEPSPDAESSESESAREAGIPLAAALGLGALAVLLAGGVLVVVRRRAG